jgi:hypothetical protein
MIITTESGTVYNLTGGFCVRNGQFEFKVWWIYCFDSEGDMPVSEVPRPYESEDAGRRLPIQVGKRMHLGGKDGWRISTKIVSIEETQ